MPTQRAMGGVYRFEDLRVWQKRVPFQRDRLLSDQENDAALSVMFNIAEGFLRRRDGETAQFLRYAFASNGELKSGYYAAEGRNYLSAAETADLVALNENIAKMLRRWQATLDPGDQRGKSHNNRPAGARTKGPGRTQDQGRTKNQGPSTKDCS